MKSVSDNVRLLRPDLLKTTLLQAVENGLLGQIKGKGTGATFQVSDFMSISANVLRLV